MRCPYCGHHDLKVVDSRDSEVGEAIRRRRECLQCGQRFTTYERIESVPFFVVKKDGRREDFDPQKLFSGLRKATEKRDISPEKLNAIVSEIEAELRRSSRVEIPAVRSARWPWTASGPRRGGLYSLCVRIPGLSQSSKRSRRRSTASSRPRRSAARRGECREWRWVGPGRSAYATRLVLYDIMW